MKTEEEKIKEAQEDFKTVVQSIQSNNLSITKEMQELADQIRLNSK